MLSVSAISTTDSEWYRAACTGDRAAFEQLAQRHHAYVYRTAAVFLNGDRSIAEDVAHKVWLNVCSHIKRVEDGELEPLELRHEHSFQAWLKRIIRNAAHDEFRRSSRLAARDIEEDDLVENPDYADSLVRNDDRSRFWGAMLKLSESCRELLTLLMQDPPPDYETIAGILDRPVGSIGPTRARCLEKLRLAL